MAHVRGPTFDTPSWQGSAAAATPGAVTAIAAPTSPVAAVVANFRAIVMH
jgi:hypothetical protein